MSFLLLLGLGLGQCWLCSFGIKEKSLVLESPVDVWILNGNRCFLTGMFALTDSLSHVTSSAFAQAQLSLLRSAHPLYTTRRSQGPSHQTSSTFNEEPEKAPPPLVRDPNAALMVLGLQIP